MRVLEHSKHETRSVTVVVNFTCLVVVIKIFERSTTIIIYLFMDLPLPIELWSVIGKHLSVLDKCALISTCRAIQAQLYHDPFWLEFTLTNLLRGLTIEEVIILIFLKADPDRVSKSRVSKFKNFITKHVDDHACKCSSFGNISNLRIILQK